MKSVGEKRRTIFFHFFSVEKMGFPRKHSLFLAHYMEALVTITKVQDQLRNRATLALRRTDFDLRRSKTALSYSLGQIWQISSKIKLIFAKGVSVYELIWVFLGFFAVRLT